MKNNINSTSQQLFYELASPTFKSAGETLASIFEIVFGNINFYKEKVNFKRAIALEEFKIEILNEIKNIPDEKVIDPPLNIVGPSIESSKYYFEDNELRSMFAKLVASSMNEDKTSNTHPSFPYIIQNLSSNDAKLLKKFSENESDMIPYALLRYQERTKSNFSSFFARMQEGYNIFDYLIDHIDPDDSLYDFSPSIDNLIRLKIIEDLGGYYLSDDNYYTPLLNNPIYHDKCNEYFVHSDIMSYELVMIKRTLKITSFGHRFISVCV